MFITFTPFDGTYVGELNSGRVAIDSIKTIVKGSRGGSIVTLKEGGSFQTATESDELQRRIDARLQVENNHNDKIAIGQAHKFAAELYIEMQEADYAQITVAQFAAWQEKLSRIFNLLGRSNILN